MRQNLDSVPTVETYVMLLFLSKQVHQQLGISKLIMVHFGVFYQDIEYYMMYE